MEQYRTEEEQLEALRRWWSENGRSTIAAVILALGVGFGWQGWKNHDLDKRESASEAYQGLLQVLGRQDLSTKGQAEGMKLAEQIKVDHSGTTYAQFAALQLARIAVERMDLDGAEAQLRWVLGQSDKGSDTASIAQLRLARVLASKGQAEQALKILDQAGEGSYKASYAVARGDILLSQNRQEAALLAYNAARILADRDGDQIDLLTLEQKIQALNPIPLKMLGEGRSGVPGAGHPAAGAPGSGVPGAGHPRSDASAAGAPGSDAPGSGAPVNSAGQEG